MEKIATIEVWRDDSPGRQSSYTRVKRDEQNEVKIVLRPQGDAANGLKPDPKLVLAHELGHAIGRIFGTQAAKESGSSMSSAVQTLRAEEEAWNFADVIYPGGSKTPVGKSVLGNYRKMAKEVGDIPMGLLRAFGLIT